MTASNKNTASDLLRKLALSLPEVVQLPHFEKTSFRVAKKIFATVDEAKQQLNVKLSLVDQDVFSTIGKESVYPVPNKWGAKGWTRVELETVNGDLLKDLLFCAYREVAPARRKNIE